MEGSRGGGRDAGPLLSPSLGGGLRETGQQCFDPGPIALLQFSGGALPLITIPYHLWGLLHRGWIQLC